MASTDAHQGARGSVCLGPDRVRSSQQSHLVLQRRQSLGHVLLNPKLIPQRIEAPCRVVEGKAYLAYTDQEATSLITLNDTGTAVWELIDGRCSISDILAALETQFAASSPETLRQEALAFLEQLHREHLVAFPPSPVIP